MISLTSRSTPEIVQVRSTFRMEGMEQWIACRLLNGSHVPADISMEFAVPSIEMTIADDEIGRTQTH